MPFIVKGITKPGYTISVHVFLNDKILSKLDTDNAKIAKINNANSSKLKIAKLTYRQKNSA